MTVVKKSPPHTGGVRNHPLWPQLRPYFRLELCARDGFKKARVRIEVRALPLELREEACAAKMPCVACGSPVRFIRERKQPAGRGTPGALYYAPTCPLDVRIGCSRGGAARDEYEIMRQAIEQ